VVTCSLYLSQAEKNAEEPKLGAAVVARPFDFAQGRRSREKGEKWGPGVLCGHRVLELLTAKSAKKSRKGRKESRNRRFLT
jgi:hypothetical protein